MKSLIISNDDKVIDFFRNALTVRGYDVIVYRWLLKALDNIEEIQPDFVIVNAAEYPRHWKTLAAFLRSGIGGDNYNFYLYNPVALPADEDKKAKILGIKKVFDDLSDVQLEGEFKNLQKHEISFPSASEDLDYIIITAPCDNSFSYGIVDNQEKDTYICSVKNCAAYTNGDFLRYVSFCHDGIFTNCSAQVVQVDSKNENLYLKIRELYETV